MFQQLLALALLGSFGSLIADDFANFRIPKHLLSSLRASLYATGNSNQRNENTRADDGLSGMIDAGLSYFYLYDSERFALEAQADLTTEVRGSDYESWNRNMAGASQFSGKSEYVEEDVAAQVEFEYYPSGSLFGIASRLAGRVVPSQEWYHSERFDPSSYSSASWLADRETSGHYYYVAAGVAPTWGRVRNVSGIYDVYLLEKRLIELGVIELGLKPSTKQALAELFYKQPDYWSLHDRSSKYFWKDVEALMMEDPAFQRPLDSYTLHRISEGVAPRSFARRRGVQFSCLIEGRHVNSIERQTESYFFTYSYDTTTIVDTVAFGSTKYTSTSDDIVFGPRIEVMKPILWTWQLSAGTELLRRIEPADDGFYWQSDLSVQYAISDRLYAGYEFEHKRLLDDQKDRGKLHGNWWSVSHDFLLGYYVEDRVRLDVGVQHMQGNERTFQPNTSGFEYESFERDAFAYVRLDCSFWGGRSYNSANYLPRGNNTWNTMSERGAHY